MWRVVVAGCATLQDIDNIWELDDILKMNAILDMQDWIKGEVERRVNRGK